MTVEELLEFYNDNNKNIRIWSMRHQELTFQGSLSEIKGSRYAEAPIDTFYITDKCELEIMIVW